MGAAHHRLWGEGEGCRRGRETVGQVPGFGDRTHEHLRVEPIHSRFHKGISLKATPTPEVPVPEDQVQVDGSGGRGGCSWCW